MSVSLYSVKGQSTAATTTGSQASTDQHPNYPSLEKESVHHTETHLNRTSHPAPLQLYTHNSAWNPCSSCIHRQINILPITAPPSVLASCAPPLRQHHLRHHISGTTMASGSETPSWVTHLSLLSLSTWVCVHGAEMMQVWKSTDPHAHSSPSLPSSKTCGA